jgi:hypothetical protein
MHIWPCKKLVKSCEAWTMPLRLKNPPKGKDPKVLEEWKKERASFKEDKLIILNKVPKASKKTS